MGSRSINIAAVVGLLIAAPTSVIAESANAPDPQHNVIVIAEARSKPPTDDAKRREAPLASDETPAVSAEPQALYQRLRYGSPDREKTDIMGIRRSAIAGPTPLALAPDHVGLTISASPSLFWHIDSLPARGVEVVFTIRDDRSINPLAEVTLRSLSRAGIQRLRLVEHAIELEPDVEYMWSIALVADTDQRSKDIISSGFIRRVPRPDALSIESQDGVEFARAGIWYDALEALSNDVDEHPNDRRARFLRSSLLREQKLDAAAERLDATTE
jgi:hypothetical protein